MNCVISPEEPSSGLRSFGWIRNRMETGRVAISEHMREAVERNPLLEIQATVDFEFDRDNNLISPFIPAAVAKA